MSLKFRIPKLSDSEAATRLDRIRQAMEARHKFRLMAHIRHHSGPIPLAQVTPCSTPQAKFAFDLNSNVITLFQLLGENGAQAIALRRKTEEITDEAEITDDWANNGNQDFRNILPQLHTQLIALLRTELQVTDAEAALKGSEDSAWTRYRDAQMSVTNSLQQATETLIINAAQKTAELDKARAERFEKLEADLRIQIEKERASLLATHESKLEDLTALEKALSVKQASFNTKESHYVARQKQTEQIEKIQSWLDNWSLTKGTSKKRWPIIAAYIVALVFTGALSAYAIWHSYDLLKSVDDVVKLAWWQWASIWAKSALPLAAFVTFTIYFIRWSGDWARQHSEEEFRNRTRLVDIGRASWLLEAVRDAQERNKEIPVDLLKELSRNLFATNSGHEPDIHPQAMSDVLLQGLSSLRLKAADGSEVEATRNGKKK